MFGNYWVMPVGQMHALAVLDIADPARPREVFRLATPDTFNPHWLARDPLSNRLVWPHGATGRAWGHAALFLPP